MADRARDEVPAEALGTVGTEDEVLPVGIRAGNLALGRVDRDGSEWMRDVERVGLSHDRRTSGLEEHSGRTGARGGDLETTDAGGCVASVRQWRRSGR
jgi:hypothetical protein